ncbi:MHYT domain-containing protein [Reinekea marina]|uniref:histidine kinase n=1 Tax=Reinekea marina TaxID=1310421 RepID=A0ABV7WTB4_9GAMM|nr:MHYT domain-containing protein [Reinekea marina]MDN3649664.1 MHYT domain-containing protein [Reinekea marina]
MQWFLELFQYSEQSLFSVTEYSSWLVLLSVSIAVFASYMGFQVAGQASTTVGVRKHVFLIVGSVALAGGVWSMHFIGMLALQICTVVTYRLDITALSIIPAIVASWIALNQLTHKNITTQQLIVCGVLVGAGIGAMHYIGMAAMEMAAFLRYNLAVFLISILVAVALAILSLWVRYGLDSHGSVSLTPNFKILISSLVMGAAISSMHYTGMAAARFVLPPGMDPSIQSGEISLVLASIITAITILMIILVLGANLIFRYRDKSDAALRNEKRLIATMDTAIDGIITIDQFSIIISVNKAVTTILGWQENELIGRPLDALNIEKSLLGKVNNSSLGYTIDEDTEVSDVFGERIPIRFRLGKVDLSDANLSVLFISDLREYHRMKAEIKRNESQIQAILSNIPGITFRAIYDPTWPILFVNDQVENILGYPKEDFMLPNPTRSINDFLHPEDVGVFERTDLLNPNGYQIEYRIIDRKGKIKWLLGYGQATQVEGIESACLDGFLMDISDRKEMESELVQAKETAEKAAESRANFLANMSHEIRTPMNSVIGFSELLLLDQVTDEQRRQLKTINQSAKSLLHILNDILDSAKLDKGKFELEYRDFSLVEEIDTVVSTFWLQAQQKGLEINLNLPKKLKDQFNGAPDRIRQVLTNLIGNSIKFTQQGSISIDVSQSEKGCTTFSISDTGIGMTSDQLENIFEPFSQADESMNRRFGGTGLGTTISKQLVELMGGKISAKSEAGVGSTFSFTIPLKPAQQVTLQASSKANTELPELSILIVDDIEQNLDLLTRLLQKDGHFIQCARNGQEALEVLEKSSVDVALIDIQMPIMDGLTASKIRRKYEQDNNLDSTPLIALTASVLAEDRLSAERAGMNGFANKPVDMQQLNREIARVLNGEMLEHIEPDSPLTETDPSTASKIVDVEKGVSLWGSKTNLYNEVKRFVDNLTPELASFKQLATEQNFSSLAAIGHKFKGGASNVAIVKLAAAFDSLEASSSATDMPATLEAIDTIFIELEALKACMQSRKSMQEGELSESTNTGSNDHSLESLVHIAAELKELTDNNEINDDLLNQLEKLQSYSPVLINEIIESCNNFEFELASEKINELREAVGV